ncbi:MAG: carboxypeptidase regulatory-like domain-containing protein [Chitinispirillaceae bacterium]|nr:carboxypeptidase regulatory-like domain-containing protein [Chitinispirillaceae bacterium]
MSKLRNVVIISCCMAFSVMAAVEISLSGTVKDATGTAISDATVTLVSDTSLKDTTAATGEFTLTNITALNSNRAFGIQMQNLNHIGIQGKQLRFSTASPCKNGVISIFSGCGKRSIELPIGKMKPGVHEYVLPELAAGFYVLNITIDQSTTTRKLVHTGSEILISNSISDVMSTSRVSGKIAAADNGDTLVVKKDGFTNVKKAITAYKQTDIAIVMNAEQVYAYSASVENTCADCVVPELPDASKLTAKNSKLPDPFIKLDGKRITKKSEWRCRRQEILKQAEKYIYGEKPAFDSVSGTVTNSKVTVHVASKGNTIDFSATIKLPTTGKAPYPAIINIGTYGSTITTKASSQGVAIINYDHIKLGKEGTVEASRGKPNSGLFYDMYGGMHSAGLLMAWAWGASRMIDVLQKSGSDIIDYRRLATTGCSRTAKGAFAVGLFDERIAVVLSEETSVAGVPAYRIADKLCPENTDNNFNGLNWLSDVFKPFVKPNTNLLPIDAHELVATFAPRGIYMMENPSATQMCAQGGHMSAVGGAEVYKALGCSQNLSYNSNTPSGTGHCSYTSNFTDMLIKNITKFLNHQPAETGGIVPGSGTLNKSDWIDWTAPTLEDDTDVYGTD